MRDAVRSPARAYSCCTALIDVSAAGRVRWKRLRAWAVTSIAHKENRLELPLTGTVFTDESTIGELRVDGRHELYAA
jgi:hypothetical protein